MSARGQSKASAPWISVNLLLPPPPRLLPRLRRLPPHLLTSPKSRRLACP